MTRSKPLRVALVLLAALAAVFVVTGCGDEDDGDDIAATVQTTTTESESGGGDEGAPDGGSGNAEKSKSGGAGKPTGTTIKLASSPVGDALFDGDDQAIYLFDTEESSTPECYDDCAEAWPPVLTKGKPAAAGPVKQGLLGTTKRDDGTTQVTYNDHPLYYYAHEGPGELRCHNVSGFGGLWLALDESGDALS